MSRTPTSGRLADRDLGRLGWLHLTLLVGVPLTALVCILAGSFSELTVPTTGNLSQGEAKQAHDDAGPRMFALGAARLAQLQAQGTPIVEVNQLRPGEPLGAAEVAVAGDPPEADKEWPGYKRINLSFASMMKYTPGTLDWSLLYRHPDLNPRDRYLCPESREALMKLVREYLPQLKDLAELTGRLQAEEVGELARQGLLTRYSPDSKGRFHLPKDALPNGGVTLRGPDGKTVAAPFEMLKLSQNARDYQCFLGIELAHRVIEWFRCAGTIHEGECRALYARLVR